LRDFRDRERAVLRGMLERGVSAPVCTSAGRLFDAVAALAGLHLRASFEGQPAMALEAAADPEVRDAYPIDLRAARPAEPPGVLVLDWEPTLRAALDDLARAVPPGTVSGRFHNALARGILLVAREVGDPLVALSGGCFQNVLLVERTVALLRAEGFRPLLHRRVPPNDGGISLGQLAAAAARLEKL
jgi:hydrogenase maturation protein HypF